MIILQPPLLFVGAGAPQDPQPSAHEKFGACMVWFKGLFTLYEQSRKLIPTMSNHKGESFIQLGKKN